ncbi:MAG: carboxypeptidase regulatory-like domain-containing protein [Candidatus Omnitrophota bacterium]|nr:carboxypeptidase regulatory-like domain-containing protein [Candidatus Omnitrophota bacterium]
MDRQYRILLTVLGLTIGLSGYAAAGSVTGTIKYDGAVPNFKEIKMDADPMCMALHKEAVYPQTLVLGDGQTMGNVFVYVKNAPAGNYTAPVDPVVIDQKGCNYDPHVVGVMVNQPVKILNPDGTLHNVHAITKVNQEFNMAMPKFRTEVIKTFDKPEFMFVMKCDVHPWMIAWVSVLPNPFFAVTKADGKFEIKDLPAGTYEINAWHEKLGTKTATVTVTDGATAASDFTFSSPTKS